MQQDNPKYTSNDGFIFIFRLLKHALNFWRICLKFSSNAHARFAAWHSSCFVEVQNEGEEPLSTGSNCNVRKLRRSGTGPSADRRLRANWPAELRTTGAKTTHCTVVDVSSDGANLRVESPLNGDAPLWLIVENVGPVAAQLAWQEQGRVGLRFLEKQEWVHQVSKHRFDPTAWLKSN